MMRTNELRPLVLRLAISVCLLAAPLTFAQDGCISDETWGECYTRLSGLDGGSARTAQKAIADAQAEEIVEAKTTSDASANSASSLANFLPRAVAALGFGEVSEEEGSQTLTFNLSPAATKGTAPDQWTVSVVRRDSEPLEALVMAVPDAIRSDRKSELQGNLGDFDDVELKVEYAFEGELLGRGFGRSFASYSDTSSAVFTAVAPPTADGPPREFLELLDELGDFYPGLDAMTLVSGPREAIAEKKRELTLVRLGAIDAATLEQRKLLEDGESLDDFADRRQHEIEQLERLEPTVRHLAAAEKQAISTFQSELRRADYFRFAELVNNQPQLHLAMHHRQRDSMVGPDEWGLKLTYEHGFGNVNSLRRECGDKPTDTCYQKFFKDHAVKSANRLSVSAEYGREEDLRFELPDDDFIFILDEVRKTIFTLAYGRSLLLDDQGNDAARLDLEGSYEDVSDDPMRQSRGLATLTYTQNLIDNNTLALSVVWANEPEYRGEVEHEWSARAGLKVKIDKKD